MPPVSQVPLNLNWYTAHAAIHCSQNLLITYREVTKAFHIACSKGLTDIINSLLKYEDFKLIESHILDEDEKQETALHVAARKNLPEVISLLLNQYVVMHTSAIISFLTVTFG